MTEPWASAHVDVDLDFGNLDQELVRRLSRSADIAQRAASRNFEKLAGNAKRSFDKIGNAYDVQMKRMERRTVTGVQAINRQLGKIDSVTAQVNVRMVGADAEQLRKTSSAITRLKRDAGKISATIDIKINSIEAVERLDAALGRIRRRYPVEIPVNVDRKGSKALAGMSFGLGGIAKKAGGALMMVGKFAAIAGSAVVAAGSLVPVLGAIGAGLFAIGGAAGTVAIGGLFAIGLAAAALKTAFSGVGDAAKNMFDPDKAEEFEKSLAKLTPAAQSTMRSVQALGKSYGEMVKKPVQEAMFAGLAPKIAQLGRFLPSVKASLVGVAEGFNDGANGALRMINSTRGMSMVKNLLGEAGNMGANFGAAITGAIPGFLSLGSAATSVLSPMTDGIGGMAHKWSESMLRMQQDGTLEKKMQGFMDTAKQIGAAFAKVGEIIGGVFRAAKAAGDGNPLGNVMGSLTTISDWVNGPGQAALTGFFTSVGQATSAILPVFLTLGEIIGTTVAPMIAELAIAIGPTLQQVAGALGQAFAALGPAIGPLGQAFQAIGQALVPIIPILGQLISQVVQTLGPVITSLAAALGPVLGSIMSAFTGMWAALEPAIAPLSQVFAALSPVLSTLAETLGGLLASAIAALMPVVQMFADIFAQLMPVITPLITMLGGVFASILSALTPVISTIAGVLGQVAGVLAGALGQAVQAIMPLFESMAPIFEQIAGVLGEFAGMLGGILVSAVTMLAPLLPLIVDAFSQLLQAVMPLVPILLELVAAALQPVLALLPALIGIIVALVPVILQLVKVFASILTAIVPVIGIIAKLIGLFMSILATIVSFVAQALALIVGWVAGIISTILGMVASVIGTIGGWVSSILGFFSDLVGKATSFVTDMWTTVSTKFSEGVGKAVSFVGELPGKIMDALKGAGKWLVDVGKDIIGGLIDGIKSMAGAIVSALINLLPGPLQGAARKALGLFTGGWVPGLATGGMLPFLAAGGRMVSGGAATTRTAPGSYIVNAAATRRNRGLLKQVSPRGRVIRGPGSGTSDSINGTYRGRTLARLSNGEWQVPPDEVGPIIPLLQAMNAGQQVAQVAANAAGGWVRGLAGGGSVGGREPYGLPPGTNTGGYGSSGDIFPAWVHEIEQKFGVKASTYPGHQEGSGQNKGIDWVGSVPDMQKFAEYLLGIAPDMEQVIWKNPETGQQIGVADGKRVGPGTDQPGYYSADWDDHMNHVHTRQSYAFGGAGGGSDKGIDTGTGGGMSTSSSGGGSTPIGSGIGSGGTSGGGSSSWGNSGGGSKFNSAADAKRGGLTAVWVENWPSSMGGGGGGGVGTSTGSDGGIGTGGGTSSGGGKDLKKGASKQDMMDAVYRIGKQKGMSDEQILAAGEALLAESDGKNYANSKVAGSTDRPHDAVGSDGLSLGVMQQQSGMGWGDDEQLMDPEYAIGRFYEEMEKNPTSGPAHAQAQAVQKSAFSDGSNYSAKEQEARDLLAKAKDNGGVPVTPSGNVPVEVTNSGDGGIGVPPADTPTTPGTTTAGDPGTTTTGTTKAAYESMPFGTARGNSWAGSQDFGGQARRIGLDALKEIGSEFSDPFGLTSAFESGFDRLVAYLEEQQKNPTEFKFADVVNFNGGDPAANKKNTTDGMTAVVETYRQG